MAEGGEGTNWSRSCVCVRMQRSVACETEGGGDTLRHMAKHAESETRGTSGGTSKTRDSMKPLDPQCKECGHVDVIYEISLPLFLHARIRI